MIVYSVEGLATMRKDDAHSDDLLRPRFEPILNAGNYAKLDSVKPQPTATTYDRLDFTRRVEPTPAPSTNPFHEDVQASSPTPAVINQLPSKPIVAIPKQTPLRHDDDDDSAEHYGYEQPGDYDSTYARVFRMISE